MENNSNEVVTIPLIAHQMEMERMKKIIVALLTAFAIVCGLLICYIGYDRWQDGTSTSAEYTVESNDAGHAVYSGEGDVDING